MLDKRTFFLKSCRNAHPSLSLVGAATGIIFVATKLDKHVFVATKRVFCRDKSMLVATKLLSR